MSGCPSFTHLLAMPHLRVQNANAISSPLTHGFPSMTAFLGLMWALERRARSDGMDVTFKSVGVVCHDHDEQITEGGFVKAFRLTRNPVNRDGSTAAIVEEGRIHLELSLVFAVNSDRWLQEPNSAQADIERLQDLLAGMRVAGGSVVPPVHSGSRRFRPYAIDLTGNAQDRQAAFRQASLRLLPGFALVARDDLLTSRLAELQVSNPQVTRLDAWLSLASVTWHHEPPADDTAKAKKDAWKHDRKGRGWIVPLPVGYGALGALHPPGHVANTRDATTPFRFVESLYSVGEWLSPHRLIQPQQLLWYADSQPDAGLYRCRNDYTPPATAQVWEHDFN